MTTERGKVELGAISRARESQQFTDAAFRALVLGAGVISAGIFFGESLRLVSERLRARKESRQKPPQE